MKTLILHLVILAFSSSVVFAQVPNINELNLSSGGTEFFVGRMEGKPLIKVQVLSGVRFPGVYHVPVDTDLIQLMSYAGGYVDRAELDEVQVRSHVAGQPALVSKYDLDSLSDHDLYPKLTNGDTVQIPVSEDYLARSAIWVGIFASIISTSLAVMIYNENRR